MILIELIGIAGGAYAVVHFFRHWPEWLGYEPAPSVHIAGPDDEDIDFAAALASLDHDTPQRVWPEWEIPRA